MTQQNAALVEQAAASSLTFQEQADRMRDTVARFKVAEEAPQPQARPQQAAPAPQPAATAAAAKVEPLPRAAPKPLPKRKPAPETVGAEDEWKEF